MKFIIYKCNTKIASNAIAHDIIIPQKNASFVNLNTYRQATLQFVHLIRISYRLSISCPYSANSILQASSCYKTKFKHKKIIIENFGCFIHVIFFCIATYDRRPQVKYKGKYKRIELQSFLTLEFKSKNFTKLQFFDISLIQKHRKFNSKNFSCIIHILLLQYLILDMKHSK